MWRAASALGSAAPPSAPSECSGPTKEKELGVGEQCGWPHSSAVKYSAEGAQAGSGLAVFISQVLLAAAHMSQLSDRI